MPLGNESDNKRLLIVEDHPMFRDGLAAVLRTMPGIELAGLARDAEEAVRMADELEPDLVLMDIHLPGINGIEATRRIVSRRPETRILILTMFDDDQSVFAAMRAGARGYLLKEATPAEIMRAIDAVGQGEAIFSPSIARRMMFYFETLQPKAEPDVFPELTDREREILGWIAKGMNNSEIAKQLGIAQKTMRNYVSIILSKLQAADRAQAIVMAREAGLGGRDLS
ncbi:DNA-binding response regulator [Cohnella xylanilytica]|uniref:response regulator transcription factor n=1 Tax=Cohnella xylanilytica TaxID=557555 RepID=UPI001B00F923|nr:response regulator transcription factor [Cohnella xylanilytica]GIO14254.1 DNA-binding response regulator [Cohnella xylanilytica]